jgi:hypothetical protein
VQQIGERILKKGSPDEKIAQAIAAAKAAEERAAALERDYQQRQQQAAQQAAILSAKKQLSDLFDQNKEALPILSKLAGGNYERLEREYMAAFRSIQSHPEARGQTFTDLEILQAIEAAKAAEIEEALEAFELEKLEGHLTKRRGSASVTTAAKNASGPQSKESATGKTSRTLGPSASAKAGSGWKPDNWDKLSDREQNRLLIERLKSGQPLD